MSTRVTCLFLLALSVTLPTPAAAEVASPRAPRSAAEIRAGIHALEREERALPGPDRTLEIGIGTTALLAGTALLVGDLAYVLDNATLWCGVGPMGDRCGAPTALDGDLTLGLGIAGGVLLAVGIVSFIVGFARRPDAASRRRREEIRDEIRRDRLELRLAPHARSGLLVVSF